MAGGTVIAVRSRPSALNRGNSIASGSVISGDECDGYGDDCIVILFRSPDATRNEEGAYNLTAASVYGSTSQTTTDTSEGSTIDDELSPLYNGPLHHPHASPTNNARILHAPTGLFLAITGFKPDVSHLLQIAAGRVLSRASVYNNGKSFDPHTLVREDLSSILIDAASSDDGRPMGTQCLVVGTSCVKRNGLEIYTIDPSGGWRSHVGWGAAVGRGAERIKTSIIKENQQLGEDDDKGWKLALDRAMMAAMDTFEVNDDNLHCCEESKLHLYRAIAIFGSRSTSKLEENAMFQTVSKCFGVHHSVLEESYRRCSKLVNERASLSVK